MSKLAITFEIIGNIGLIKGTNPPVNALSYDVRKGLVETLNLFLNNKDIEGIILCGEGRTFFAGADISEFGKPMQGPNLNEVIFESDSQLIDISNECFQYCSDLSNIELPSSVEKLGAGVFRYCSNLEQISFGLDSSLNYIGNNI